MISRVGIATILSLSAFALTAGPVHAHGGGLDSHGCHHDRKNGGYHCHQGPFAGQAFAFKQEMLDTLEAHNQHPNIDVPLWVQSPRRSDNPPESLKILRASL